MRPWSRVSLVLDAFDGCRESAGGGEERVYGLWPVFRERKSISLTIEWVRRFRGTAGSYNGAYTCGRVCTLFAIHISQFIVLSHTRAIKKHSDRIRTRRFARYQHQPRDGVDPAKHEVAVKAHCLLRPSAAVSTLVHAQERSTTFTVEGSLSASARSLKAIYHR